MTPKSLTKPINSTEFSVRVKKRDEINYADYNSSLKLLPKVTGSENVYGSFKIFQTTVQALITGGCSTDELELKISQLYAIMSELKPNDAFEGMLISQMITVYDQAMDCFKYVNLNKSNPEAVQRLQNQAIKLMRLYNQQLEALDKHRNKGKQKMTVEHVHVHKGGQAIVGNVNQGEGRGHNGN